MARETNPKIVSKKHLARLEREHQQQKLLRVGAIAIIILVVGVIIFGILDQTVLMGQKAVARVENNKITVSEYEKQVKYYRWQMIQQYQSYLQIYQMLGSDPNYGASFLQSLQQIQSQMDPSNAAVIGSTVLDDLIDQQIIKMEAQKRGISVSDAEVEEYLQNGFYYHPNGTPTPTITPTVVITSTLSSIQMTLVPPTATATTMPAAETPSTPTTIPTATATVDPALPTSTPFPTPTPYTQEGYMKALADYVDELSSIGFTEKDLRQLISTNLLRSKVFDAITADTPHAEEMVWARHILLNDEATAQEVLNKLNAGEDWSKLAAEYSQDTSNKNNAGDLGWFGKGKMVAEFEDIAFKLNIGEISQPVKTQFGYHIIQVLGHEVRALDQSAYDSAKQQKFTDWLAAQKESVKIEKYDIWEKVVPAEPTIPAELQQ